MGISSTYREAEQRYWASLGVEPREEWLRLASTGGRVRVQVVGEGPPVLFLHGVNTAGTVWAPLAARLPQFRCLLVDRPGCGLSDPFPAPVDDVPAFVERARRLPTDLLDALGLERAPVVSTSLGGFYALHSAAAQAERITGVVQVGWAVGAPNPGLPLVMRLGGSPRLGKLSARLPVPKRAVRPMLAQIGLRGAVAAGRVSDEMVGWFHALLNETPTMRHELDASPPIITFRGMNASVLFSDDVLARTAVPVTFLWGADDPFGGADVARAFAARIPGSSLTIVPGAGHALWVDDPDGAASLVGAALRSISG